MSLAPALVLALILPLSMAAQSIRGQVLDVSGAAISGAEVEAVNAATGWKGAARTDPSGYYVLVDLPLTGEYRVRLAHAGFAPRELEHIRLQAGETATLNATLGPEPGRSRITVFGTVEGVRSDSPELGSRLDTAAVANTPVMGRRLTNLPLLDSTVRPARGTGDAYVNNTLFVVAAGGRRQTTYVLDGSTADDAWGRQTIFTSIPLAALQEVTVLTNAFSAEYGRTASAVLEVSTRAGTNAFHGEVSGMWRPPGLQARWPLSERRTADRLEQASGAVSGPLVRDRTHFLLSAEFNRQDRDSTVTSPLAPGNYRGRYRQGLVLARLDHQVNRANRLLARVNLDRFDDRNPSDAVGGLSLPSAARTFRRAAYAGQVSETAALSGAMLNEARVQYQIGSPIARFTPVTPGTQFVWPGLATEGESRSSNLQNHQTQLSDTLSLARGAHNVRFGGDGIYSSSGGFGQEFGGGFVLGQFTMRPGPGNDVQIYRQTFGDMSYQETQWLGAAFVQDDWKLHPTLTLNLGLRYDSQSFSDDRRMWSPRVGFAYNPRGDRRTSIRGGYGVFYSQLRANLAAGWAIGGPEGIFTFSAAPGQLGFPMDFKPLPALPAGAALPPRDITVRPGGRAYLSRFFDVSRLPRYPDQLLNPRTQQATIGVERELASRWVLSANYVHQYTTRIDRPLDLNAPAPFVRTTASQVRSAAVADETRPIRPVPGGYRRILAVLNDGMAKYDALQANLAKRFSRGFAMRASYTYSHAINSVEPDTPQQDPNDANLLGRLERASSLLDQRHRAVLSGWWQFRKNWTAGSVTSLASGRPFNVTTGVDNNGDGVTADRPVIGGSLLGRNTGRGTPVYDAAVFLEREFRWRDRLRLSLRGEAFNALNHGNIAGRNGVFGSGETPLPSFGQALGGINNVDPGREFQFLLKATF